MPNRQTTLGSNKPTDQGVYLDYAATAPMTPQARDAWMSAAEQIGNPSSAHTHGTVAHQLLEQARHDVAACLGCPAEEIIFTSGGTESNSLAIIGRALATSRGTILTTAMEHSSIFGAMDVAERLGMRSQRILPSHAGVIDPAEVLAAIDEETVLISVQHANNETGVIQPIAEIAEELAELPFRHGSECGPGTTPHGVLLHSDAVHTAGKLGLRDLPSVMLSLSAHKFGGPRGVGVLRVPGGVAGGAVSGILRGGAQELGLRAGTENVPGVVSAATSLVDAIENLDANRRRAQEIRRTLETAFSATGWRPTSLSPTVETTLSGWFPGVRGDTLMYAVDQYGLSISTGSACHSDAHEPSHVLSSMELPKEQIDNTVRLSFSGTMDIANIRGSADTIVAQVRRLQQLFS